MLSTVLSKGVGHSVLGMDLDSVGTTLALVLEIKSVDSID